MLAYNLSLLYNCSRLDVLLFVFYLGVSRQDEAKRKSSLEILTSKATPLRPILRLGTELLLDTQKAVVFGYTLRTRE